MRQWTIWWIALLLAGCGMHDPIIHRLLEQGDGIPPRARMHSLDSVDDLEWLSMECQCNYFYLRVKARYDLGQVHAADTLLIAQAAYFERRGEPAKAAYLSLAAGRAFRETGLNEEAFRCISEAESLVCDLPDKFPLFCVYYEWGSLAAHEGDTGEANEQFGKMVALARAYPELQDHLETGRYALKAAKALLFLGDYDRAVYWYGKITARMVQMEDSARASAVFSEMAYSLDKTGRTVEALAYADSAQVYAPDSLSILRSTLLKASFYYRLEDAAALAVQLEQASSLFPAGGIRDREHYYYLLSQLCRLRGDYRAAYDNFMRYGRALCPQKGGMDGGAFADAQPLLSCRGHSLVACGIGGYLQPSPLPSPEGREAYPGGGFGCAPESPACSCQRTIAAFSFPELGCRASFGAPPCLRASRRFSAERLPIDWQRQGAIGLGQPLRHGECFVRQF